MPTHETAKRFPLTWPDGVPRTAYRISANFRSYKQRLTVAQAVGRLESEIRLLRGKSELLSSNLDLNLSGQPRSSQAEPRDPGAALWFYLKDRPLCFPCDHWNRVADNIAAIAAHIDAMRRMQRYKVGSIEQAFAGYITLPPKATEWWVILGVPANASIGQINERFRELAQTNHPDRGGNLAEFQRLSEAVAAARKAVA